MSTRPYDHELQYPLATHSMDKDLSWCSLYGLGVRFGWRTRGLTQVAANDIQKKLVKDKCTGRLFMSSTATFPEHDAHYFAESGAK